MKNTITTYKHGNNIYSCKLYPLLLSKKKKQTNKQTTTTKIDIVLLKEVQKYHK